MQPLEGTRIIDLTHYTVGPFATRLLSDYGAEVIKIEPPGGDPARGLPPFFQDRPGLERSGLFLALNTNKQSVVLDLTRPEHRERLLALVATADALVENFAPGTLERLGLGVAALHEVNPRLVVTSISNFGQTGPYRDWPGTDLTIYGMGAAMLGFGNASLSPLRVAGRMAGYQTSIVAALATATGIYAARSRGFGEHVDVSMFEALTHSIEYRPSNLLGYQYNGRIVTRTAGGLGIGQGVYPCKDGFVSFTVTGRNAPKFFEMIGQAELLDRPEWQPIATAMADQERIEEFNTYRYPWLLERTRDEVRAACQRYGVPGAPLYTIGELPENEQFVARAFFHRIDHPETGPLLYPGYHFKVTSEGHLLPQRRRAPLLGEHTTEILKSDPTPERSAPRASANALAAPPLRGLRVLDFTVIWAGPYATMQLADWGAEVIRVESLQHAATGTRGSLAHPPPALGPQFADTPMRYPNDDVGARPWNRSAFFNAHARGKRSMTVDLTRPDGREVFARLVASADGLIENNVPPTAEMLGLTWERLSKINPRLILVRMPAFGTDGPYSDYRTMGSQMECIIGHPVLRAYPDYGLDVTHVGVPADAASGAAGALAFVLGLMHRQRTGQGLAFELATAENMVPMLGEFVMDYSMNRREWSHMGNEHWWLAPHNVYRCHGADRWVTIVVRNEAEWPEFCDAIGHRELIADTRFADMPSRWKHRAELDEIIGAWTRTRDAAWIADRLLARGIPAGVLMNERDILQDPQHAHRGFFQAIDSVETGRQRYVGQAWHASASERVALGPPPRLGEDNEYLYREVLGYSEAEYRRFEETGHIGMDYLPNVP